MIKNQGCHILVGTPGRLKDILSDPYSQVRAPNLSAFVLDEADRLLDQGFAPDIEEIQRHLPKRSDVDRQTLLYSATVPPDVMHIVRRTMKRDFQFVRTVQEGEQQTHEKVPQRLVKVEGFENLVPAMLELCKREISKTGSLTETAASPFKAMVFFNATADVQLTSAILQNLRELGGSNQDPLYPARIIEIHARLSQEQRNRAAERFKRAESAIMITTDVTARGMDFPNVTHVIQVGIPPSQEQYVHRLGRTARGGKSGEGWVIVTGLEAREIRHRLNRMPLKPDRSLETAGIDMKKDAQLPEHVATTLTQVQDATRLVPRGLKVAAYQAAIGIYSWIPHKQDLVDAMNDRARYGWGMEQSPKISPGLASKMGLNRTIGLNIGHEEDRGDRGVKSGFGRSSMGGAPRQGGFDRGRSSYGDRDRQSSYGSRDRSDGGGYGRPSSGGYRGYEHNSQSSYSGRGNGGYQRARDNAR